MLKGAHEWVRDNVWLLLAILGGILVSVLASEHHSPKEAFRRVAAGLFCGWFFPDPFLDWLDRDPSIYGNAVAALFAMTGYALARVVVNFDGKSIAEWIAIAFGRGGDK